MFVNIQSTNTQPTNTQPTNTQPTNTQPTNTPPTIAYSCPYAVLQAIYDLDLPKVSPPVTKEEFVRRTSHYQYTQSYRHALKTYRFDIIPFYEIDYIAQFFGGWNYFTPILQNRYNDCVTKQSEAISAIRSLSLDVLNQSERAKLAQLFI